MHESEPGFSLSNVTRAFSNWTHATFAICWGACVTHVCMVLCSGFWAVPFVPPLQPPVLHLNAELIVSWMPPNPKGARCRRLSRHLWLYLSISVSPPQWAPGPENSYLAGQDPLKWPFLAAPTIQPGWEDTKEVRAGALDRQFGGREDRCMNDSNCASLHKNWA